MTTQIIHSGSAYAAVRNHLKNTLAAKADVSCEVDFIRDLGINELKEAEIRDLFKLCVNCEAPSDKTVGRLALFPCISKTLQDLTGILFFRKEVSVEDQKEALFYFPFIIKFYAQLPEANRALVNRTVQLLTLPEFETSIYVQSLIKIKGYFTPKKVSIPALISAPPVLKPTPVREAQQAKLGRILGQLFSLWFSPLDTEFEAGWGDLMLHVAGEWCFHPPEELKEDEKGGITHGLLTLQGFIRLFMNSKSKVEKIVAACKEKAAKEFETIQKKDKLKEGTPEFLAARKEAFKEARQIESNLVVKELYTQLQLTPEDFLLSLRKLISELVPALNRDPQDPFGLLKTPTDQLLDKAGVRMFMQAFDVVTKPRHVAYSVEALLKKPLDLETKEVSPAKLSPSKQLDTKFSETMGTILKELATDLLRTDSWWRDGAVQFLMKLLQNRLGNWIQMALVDLKASDCSMRSFLLVAHIISCVEDEGIVTTLTAMQKEDPGLSERVQAKIKERVKALIEKNVPVFTGQVITITDNLVETMWPEFMQNEEVLRLFFFYLLKGFNEFLKPSK